MSDKAFEPVKDLPNKESEQYIDYKELPVDDNPVELSSKVEKKVAELAERIIAGEIDKRAADVELMELCDGVELAAAMDKLSVAITAEADKNRSLPSYSGLPVYVNCGLKRLQRALDGLND